MPLIENIIRRAADTIVSHARLVLLGFLLATALLGWQARRFEIDATADTLLMRDNRHYIETQIMTRRFSPREFLLIAYEPRQHDLLSRQTFDDLRAISERLRKLDRVESVRSILNVPLFGLADAGLSSDADPSQWTLANRDFDTDRVREALKRHPVYEGLIINARQTATAIQVLFKEDDELDAIQRKQVALQEQRLEGGLSRQQESTLSSLKQQAAPIKRRLDRVRRREVKTIRRLLEPYETRANLYLGGVHVLGFQLIRIIRNDLIVFGGAIAAMIAVILFLLFRRIRWVLIPIVCCGVSVLSTMGLFGMLGLKTTVISSNFIALQLILTLALVIHLIVQYREYNSEHPDWNQARLVRATLMRKASPCFYAGITTSVGFGSLLFSNIQPVIAFGWMMIVAMFVSIGVSLILFPAMMALFDRESTTQPLAFSRFMLNAFAALTLHRAFAVAAVSAAILGASVAGCFRLDVENSFLNYFRESTQVRKELSFIDRQFGGSTPLDLVYALPDREDADELILTAENVRVLQRVQHALQRHEAVGKILSVVSLTDLARRLNHDQPLTEYELTAIYRMMDDSLREDLLGSFLSLEHNQARFGIRIRDTTPGLDRGALLLSIRKDLRELGIADTRYRLTNLFVLYQDILQRLFRSQMMTLGIVYAVLTLTFWAIFRSLRIALIGMIPNIFSTATVLGVMGWLDIPLDLMTITIAAIAMGIAVDDTIHYVHRYLEETEIRPAAEAVTRSHGSVGYAILYTSLIVILGFSLLACSDFVPSMLFGLLSGLAMATALLSDLCILPALLCRFVTDRHPR